uniref:Uncharacterized protein n=1 Tax=Aegilops tauschii subsp. strangulata TaxID=200361 RepID=A0A453BQA9_AEGTS
MWYFRVIQGKSHFDPEHAWLSKSFDGSALDVRSIYGGKSEIIVSLVSLMLHPDRVMVTFIRH